MIAETFTQLLKDPGHWMFELFLMGIFDGLIGVVGVRLWRRWHHDHDRKLLARGHAHPLPQHSHYHISGSQRTGQVDTAGDLYPQLQQSPVDW